MSKNRDEREVTPEGCAGGPSVEETDTETLSDTLSGVEALAAERDALLAEKAELQNRLLRRQADFDNFRKRAERERQEFSEYASMEAVRALLPVLDDFERALQAETGDKEYAKGMELIYGRLAENLKKLGLEAIEAKGAKFDPNLHYAIERVSDSDAEDETVLEELQRGYNFKNKLLRPAMVRVAMK